MKHRQASNGVIAGNGINGSRRKREVTQPQQHTEYYLFNSQGNLKAYSDDIMDFAYYGYNAANTRTYKLSLYNTNLWINGQQQPLHLQLQQAMFYPNTYLNFDAFGNYTKHYYNGMERVASRLGDNNTTIAIDNMLENRKLSLEERVRNDIQELISEPTQVDMPPMLDILELQPTGTPNDIYYYHINHLGNTAFITDNNATITQGFLYAPFGEITTEYNVNFGNNTIPKYSFNAKELDDETGMYYYEARYYKPPVFTSRDPMFEKYFWMTPYAYCANNPVKYVDPDGRFFQDPPPPQGKYTASANSRYIGFGLRNPLAALRIGFGVTHGASNISTNATRFATRGEVLFGSKRTQEDRCSENGAFRHALWQATITSEFDRSIAAQAGNAHENNPFADLSLRKFSSIDEADQVVDMLNNIIGRNIGESHKGIGMKDLAMIVLDEFYTNGLYTAKKNSEGNYIISKTRLTSEKYSSLKNLFEELNNCGRTPSEQQDADMIEKQRLECLQATWGTMK